MAYYDDLLKQLVASGGAPTTFGASSGPPGTVTVSGTPTPTPKPKVTPKPNEQPPPPPPPEQPTPPPTQPVPSPPANPMVDLMTKLLAPTPAPAEQPFDVTGAITALRNTPVADYRNERFVNQMKAEDALTAATMESLAQPTRGPNEPAIIGPGAVEGDMARAESARRAAVFDKLMPAGTPITSGAAAGLTLEELARRRKQR